MRRRGVRKVKLLAWQGTAKLLDLAQRTPVQASLIGGGALLPLLLIIGNRKVSKPGHTATAAAKGAAPAAHWAGRTAQAAGATSLLMFLRKVKDKEETHKQTPVSRSVLAATAVKAFLNGARSSKKGGTTRPGRKVAWRGLATAIGAALGSYWHSQKERRA
jgi:hypothetical protein